MNEERKTKHNIIGRIADSFINQFQLAILIILLIISIGIFGVYTLPKESLPEIVFPAIIVQTPYIGATPEDVEALVTDRIESKLEGIDDIDNIVSQSSFGFSVVTVTFIESVDIDRKKLEVDNLLREISFPSGVEDYNTNIFKTSKIPLLNMSISGDYSLEELTTISEDIQSEIGKINGVDTVNLYGGLKREIHIIIDQIKMLEYKVSMTDIQNSINSLNIGLPIGELNLNGIRYSLRVDEKFDNVSQIENVLIRTNTGSMVYIKDIATVYDSNETITTYNNTFVNDGSDEKFTSVFLEVLRETNSDVLGTTNKVIDKVENGKGTLYRGDIKINYSNKLADSVTKDLSNIQESAISGLIVVILVLFLFIGFREALIVSITIPLSLLGTVGVLNVFGITFNTFAILGLIVALGLLVDNSIIVMENINRLKGEGLNSFEAASEGTNQVAFPIFAATLTTIAAFFPLAILPGILGDFISTIPLTIIITLVVSLIVSIVVTPTISARILKKSEKSKELSKTMKIIEITVSLVFVSLLSFYAFSDKGNNMKTGIGAAIIFSVLIGVKEYRAFFNKKTGVMLNRYGTFIERVIKSKAKKALILTLGVSVLLGSFFTFSTGALKVSFFPINEPNSVTIEIDTPGGTTLEETAFITESVENILKENKDIAQFNTTIGGSEIDKAIINVSLLTNDELSGTGFEVVDQIEKELYNVAGAEIIIKGVASGPPIGSPISIKLIGDNLEELNSATSSYTEILKSIGGVYNVNSSIKNGVPQIIIDVNENKALMYGLSVSDITNQVRAQIAGIKTSVLNENREEVNIVIKKDEININDITEINNMYIVSKSGTMIPLNFLATLREFSSISSINHEESERIVTIDADLKQGFNINDVVYEFKELIKSVPVSDAIEIQYSGDIEGITENFIYLFQSMILAVFLVFIILTIQFKSIAQPFAILTTVPMAIIGVIWGLVITSNDFGFYSFMGLVALVGIAVNDAIVLIDYMNYLRANGSSLNEAVKEATLTRFNPVLATTMTTIGGVLPLAFKEVYYAEFSFSLIFGLLVTTILTLVFIPIMYSIIENIKIKIGLSNSSTSRV